MLRSLDVQQVLLQSNKTERIQQAHMNSPESQQRHFESELVKERRELREKTKDLEASGRLKIKEEKMLDKRKRNRNKKRAKEEQKSADDTAADLSAGEPGSKVDIRV